MNIMDRINAYLLGSPALWCREIGLMMIKNWLQQYSKESFECMQLLKKRGHTLHDLMVVSDLQPYEIMNECYNWEV